MSNTSEKKTILFGLGWSSLSTIVNGLTQILRLSILSRFLEKEEFGIVAILTFIVGLTQVFSDLGFSAAIMSQKDLKQDEFMNLYWVQFLLFIGFFFIISCCSYPISIVYDIPSLTLLIPITLLELPLLGIGKLYDTVLQKNLLFKTIAIRNITAALLSLVLAIALAVFDCGVYSMVLSTIFNALVINVWNFIKGQLEYKIQIRQIDIKSISGLIRVGMYQMGTQILDYISSKLDILIISFSLGTNALGVYNLAKELILKFVMIINSIVSRVMLPVLAKHQDDLPMMKQIFLEFIGKLSLLNAPIIAFIVLFNNIIIQIFYGKNYMDAGPIIQLMAIWSIFVVISMPNGFVAIATKRTDITFAYTILRITVMSAMLLAFARNSLINAVCTMIGAYFIMFFINWRMLLKKILNLKISEYAQFLYKPWLGFAFIVIIVSYGCNQINISSQVVAIAIELCTFTLLSICYIVTFERATIFTLTSKILRYKKNV